METKNISFTSKDIKSVPHSWQLQHTLRIYKNSGKFTNTSLIDYADYCRPLSRVDSDDIPMHQYVVSKMVLTFHGGANNFFLKCS